MKEISLWGFLRGVMSMVVMLAGYSMTTELFHNYELMCLGAFISFVWCLLAGIIFFLCQIEPVSLVIVYLNTMVTISEHAHLTLWYIFS